MNILKFISIGLCILMLFGCQNDQAKSVDIKLSQHKIVQDNIQYSNKIQTMKLNKPAKTINQQYIKVIRAYANPKISYINVGDILHFNASKSYSDFGEIISYKWIDQENIVLSEKAIFDRTFWYEGIYVKTLNIIDDKNNSALNKNVIVVGEPDDYLIFTQPDFEQITLSKLHDNNLLNVVQSKIIKYNNIYNSIDHWIFDFKGGELEIDLLSEMSSLDSFIDIDNDNKQLAIDTFIYLHKQINDTWQLISQIDDDLSKDGTRDGSTHYYDPYIRTKLDGGSYMITVGTFPFYEDEIFLDRKQSTSIYENLQGPYQLSFNYDLNFTQMPKSVMGIQKSVNFFTFDVLKNDQIVNSFVEDKLNIVDVYLDKKFGKVKIVDNKIVFYPNIEYFNSLSNVNILQIDIDYKVQNALNRNKNEILHLYLTI